MDRQTETEEKDRTEEIAKWNDESFETGTVFSLAENQSEQQRANRFRDVNRLSESRKNKERREHNDHEHFVRRNTQQPVQQRRSPATDNDQANDEPERESRRRQDAAE